MAHSEKTCRVNCHAPLKLGAPCYKLTIGKAFAKVQKREKEKAEAIERARVKIEQALKKAEVERKPSTAFDAADALGELPDGERADAVAKFKEALGPKLNISELKKTVRGKRKLKKAGGRKGDLKLIVVSARHLRNVTEDAVREMAAHNNPPVVFLRGGTPARISVDELGNHSIKSLDESGLRCRLADVADFYQINGEENSTPTNPPLDVVRNIFALDLHKYSVERKFKHPFPALDGITETPVLRPDGTICSAPGYDAATRMFHAPAPDLKIPPIPDKPTVEQVRAAVELIDEAVDEFLTKRRPTAPTPLD